MKVELKIIDPRIEGLGYAKPGDAAVDLRACSVDFWELNDKRPEFVLNPGETAKVRTGVAIHAGSLQVDGEPLALEDHFNVAGLVLPRSGLGSKGIRLANTLGLIDSGYCGEIILIVENAGQKPFTINALDRLAQYMIVPVFCPQYHVVTEFSSASERGSAGFGSSGVE